MNTQEYGMAKQKVSEYEKLSSYKEKLCCALQELAHQYGFTGNTRESRRVISIGIGFSQTRGGHPPISDAFDFPDYVIEASELGQFLIERVRNKIKEIQAQIDLL